MRTSCGFSSFFRILLLCLLPIGNGCGRLPTTTAPDQQLQVAQQLSTSGQGLLRNIIEAGKFSALRWPDFSDYRDDVNKFYQGYGYTLPWVTQMQPTKQAREMIACFEHADEKGLSPDDYDGPHWREWLADLKPETRQARDESAAVRLDIAVTVSAIRYISDLHVGRVNPEHLDFQVDVARRRLNLPDFLREDVVTAPNVSTILARIEPPYPGYQRAIHALLTYEQFANEDDGEVLPVPRKPILPGNSYEGMPRLAHLLRLLGDLPQSAPTPASGIVYEGALVSAVKNFQQRNGLEADGRINGATIAELNVPFSRRVRQMQLTLERWRWMPNEYQHSPIVVNIPEFRLRAYDDQFRIATTMKVVVGKSYRHKTPVFMGTLRYVIFRPYWEVPLSIAEGEMIPAIQRSPAYMTKENLEFVDNRGNAVAPGSVTPEMLERAREGKLLIRQKPGPTNALGLVKFLFPNAYDVYMHDTPATTLFSRSRRDFSHGCIRLEKPAELARWVLRDNPGWTMDRIQAAMNGEETEQITLTHPIPVLIVYGTVFVSEDGLVHIYDDIYGYDAALELALEKGYPYPR
jgi:L,D-transpeptidase YcbB